MKLKRLDYAIDIEKVLTQLKAEYTILLDSCIRVSDTGDYSLLVFNPDFIVSGDRSVTKIIKNHRTDYIDKPILEFLDEYRSSIETVIKERNEELVFNGGFVGYLSYDFGMRQLGITRHNNAYHEIPEVCFGYYTEYILVDWIKNCTHICSDNEGLMKQICNSSNFKISEAAITSGIQLDSNFTKEEFENRVQQVRQYIKRGDVYQVNISQQFRGKASLNALELYRRFRKANYGPYNAYLSMNEFSILSTSPEQFVRVRNGQITSRPIKGTIKKSNNTTENQLLKQELLDSEKNRAELLMIIDLERNDLSKICVPGSVVVEKLYTVEEYATVNHLVSTINGTLLPQIAFGDIVKGMFPGGSITGAPKIRSMEIIEELENTSRGIYTGSIGYVSNNGNMDFNIAIRTAVVTKEGVFYNVGGGITWDSDPAEEFEETIHKGRAIYQVLVGGEGNEGSNF